MNKEISVFRRGDMTLRYETDSQGRVGFLLIPRASEPLLKEKNCQVAPMAEISVRGDKMPPRFSSGRTRCGGESTSQLLFVGQETDGDAIMTRFADPTGTRKITHTAIFSDACRALECYTEFENAGKEPLTLEMIASTSIGGLTPFDAGEAPDSMEITTATSAWSAEGRFVTESIEDACLETSWGRYGIRLKKIGVNGSMPVNGYFPFLAVHDKLRDVTWAIQLACASSWQLEARRFDYGLSMSGGIADFDTGHWAKTLQAGETFRTPSLYLTASAGDAEKAAQRLLDLHERNRPKQLKKPPVMFNEWCTSWGDPNENDLAALAQTLKKHGMEYFVIDAGWYKEDGTTWTQSNGDWIPNETVLFPSGLKATADAIRAAGMVPGIWFESETCGPCSRLSGRTDLLLTRFGTTVDNGSRRFLDMRKAEAQAYLDERVIGLLKKCGFGYIKNDYNETIGTGVDGAESLGEGLRQSVEGSKEFFRRIRREVPGIVMENCSSGGHRLEPSLMALFDMASFSDAHECVSIPVIAANLHRLILPAQSQIWAVLHAEDSMKRLHYSLVSTFLGVMCLSGKVNALSDAQWALVDRDIDFYRKVRHLIAHGESRVRQIGVTSYSDLKGYQTVVREDEREALVTVHTFGGELPETVCVPVGEGEIADAAQDDGACLFGGVLRVPIKENFEAHAFWIKKQ